MASSLLEWDLADRLRKSLRFSDTTAGEIAAFLGVHRTTVSGWLRGHNEPGIGMLRLWSLRCGVPFRWLAYGEKVTSSDVLAASNERLSMVVDQLGGPARPKGLEPLTSWFVVSAIAA